MTSSTLLLDTHSFIWFIEGSPQMSATARQLIEDEGNEKWVSLASIWEMAIKISVGKLTLDRPLDRYIREHMESNGFRLLPIGLSHVVAIAGLPFHHRDPFDRLLIVQCLEEGMALVSADTVLDSYGIPRLW